MKKRKILFTLGQSFFVLGLIFALPKHSTNKAFADTGDVKFYSYDEETEISSTCDGGVYSAVAPTFKNYVFAGWAKDDPILGEIVTEVTEPGNYYPKYYKDNNKNIFVFTRSLHIDYDGDKIKFGMGTHTWNAVEEWYDEQRTYFTSSNDNYLEENYGIIFESQMGKEDDSVYRMTFVDSCIDCSAHHLVTLETDIDQDVKFNIRGDVTISNSYYNENNEGHQLGIRIKNNVEIDIKENSTLNMSLYSGEADEGWGFYQTALRSDFGNVYVHGDQAQTGSINFYFDTDAADDNEIRAIETRQHWYIGESPEPRESYDIVISDLKSFTYDYNPENTRQRYWGVHTWNGDITFNNIKTVECECNIFIYTNQNITFTNIDDALLNAHCVFNNEYATEETVFNINHIKNLQVIAEEEVFALSKDDEDDDSFKTSIILSDIDNFEGTIGNEEWGGNCGYAENITLKDMPHIDLEFIDSSGFTASNGTLRVENCNFEADFGEKEDSVWDTKGCFSGTKVEIVDSNIDSKHSFFGISGKDIFITSSTGEHTVNFETYNRAVGYESYSYNGTLTVDNLKEFNIESFNCISIANVNIKDTKDVNLHAFIRDGYGEYAIVAYSGTGEPINVLIENVDNFKVETESEDQSYGSALYISGGLTVKDSNLDISTKNTGIRCSETIKIIDSDVNIKNYVTYGINTSDIEVTDKNGEHSLKVENENGIVGIGFEKNASFDGLNELKVKGASGIVSADDGSVIDFESCNDVEINSTKSENCFGIYVDTIKANESNIVVNSESKAIQANQILTRKLEGTSGTSEYEPVTFDASTIGDYNSIRFTGKDFQDANSVNIVVDNSTKESIQFKEEASVCLTNEVKDNAQIKYYYSANSDMSDMVELTDEVLATLVPGTYYFQAVVESTDNYYKYTTPVSTLTVVKANINVPQEIEIVEDETTGEIILEENPYYTYTTEAGVDENHVKIRLTLKDKVNSTWSDGSTEDKVIDYLKKSGNNGNNGNNDKDDFKFPWWIIILILILIAATITYFYIRNKKKEKKEN